MRAALASRATRPRAGGGYVLLVISIQSAVLSTLILKGTTGPFATYSIDEATLISHYVGKTAIRESTLLNVLGSVMTPRNESLYLESLTSTSFSGCSTPNFNKELYSNAFMRTGFTGIQYGVYNLTFLGTHEFIMLIIDCTFPLVVNNDVTASRVYYLTRQKTNPEDMYIITVSFSTRNDAVLDQYQEGAVSVTSFSLTNDLRVTR